MFRPMRRQKQQLSAEECQKVLKEEKRGVLSVLGDGGYPYGMPMNHLYCPEEETIYFHGGRLGHKIDALRACPKASFCVYDQGYVKEVDWALNVRSVIVFGQIEFVEDREKTLDVSRLLSYKFTADEGYIADEIARSGSATLVLRLKIEHMTGKLVNEK